MSDTNSNLTTYVIWSHDHDMWWGPNYEGYAANLLNAGVYTETEARDICLDANYDPKGPEHEVMWRLDRALERYESHLDRRDGTVWRKLAGVAA